VKVLLPLLKHLDQRDEGLFCVIKLDHFFEWDLNATMFRVALESFQDELIRRILQVAVSQHQEDVLWLVLKQQL
jgi:hypothetical protein